MRKLARIPPVLVGGAAMAAVCLALIAVAVWPEPEGTSLTFQTPFAPDTPEFRQLQMVLDRFRENNSDIDVTLLPDGPREQDLIIRSILAGRAPDIMEVSLANLGALASRSYLVELDAVLSDRVGRVSRSVLNGIEHMKGIYAAPLRARSLQLICNATVLRKSGYRPDDPLLSNWTELLITCSSIRRYMGREGVFPLGIAGRDPSSLPELYAMLLRQTEGKMLVLRNESPGEDAPTWRISINNEAGIHALKMLAQLGEYVPPDALHWSHEDLLNEFIAGRVGMFFGDAGALSAICSAAPHLEVKAVEAPEDRAAASCVEVYGAVMLATARRQDACKKLLAFLCSTEAQTITMTGGTTDRPAFAPVQRGFLSDPWYSDHREYKPFLKALDYAVDPQPIDGWREVQRQVLSPELRMVAGGRRDPESAAERIQKRGNSVLSTYYGAIGHVSETTKLGMAFVGLAVFLLVFFTVGQRAKE